MLQDNKCFDKLARAAVFMALIAFFVTGFEAQAQGLVGVPPSHGSGQSNEVGQLADFGYDTSRDISHAVTAISAIGALAIGIMRGKKKVSGRYSAKRIWSSVAIVVFVPLIVHLIGAFIINNTGGLAGGM